MQSSGQYIAFIVGGAAVIAAGVISYQMLGAERDDIDRLEMEVQALKTKLNQQTRIVDILSEELGDAEAAPRVPASAVAPDDGLGVDAKFENVLAQHDTAIGEMRESIAELQKEVGRALPVVRSVARELEETLNAPIPPDQVVPTPEEVPRLQARLLSRDLTIADKLAILRQLRSANARSNDIANHMASAYYQTEDGNARSDIFRQLSGVTTPELRTALLDAVEKDEFADVREEAAETLADYLPDAEVQQWLEYLADNDPDRAVRAQANNSLRRLSLQ